MQRMGLCERTRHHATVILMRRPAYDHTKNVYFAQAISEFFSAAKRLHD
jgi:hypothetical protein